MAAYDVKKELKSLYAPRNTDWEVVDVAAMAYLAVDGEGDPNTAQAHRDAVEALYTVAYTLRFADRERPFVVAPLEGLWWADDPSVFASRVKVSSDASACSKRSTTARVDCRRARSERR